MIFNAKSEPAVSPVIGTILLVAIAVVLVAIILAVVMGFSGDPNEKKVGLNAKSESGANATLILYGGASLDELVKLEMIDQGSPNGKYVPLWKKDSDTVFVGLPYLAEGVAQPLEPMAVYDTRINVRGTFSDGTEVILLVQPMTFYDVLGSSQNTDTQKQPFVSEVKVISESGSMVTLGFDYKDATSDPTWGRIFYREKYSGTDFAVLRGITGTKNAAVGSYQTESAVSLKPGTIYEMYAVLSTGTQGSVTDITPSSVAFSYIQGTPVRGSVMSLKFDYVNANKDPTYGIIYYREKGTDTYTTFTIQNTPDTTHNASSGSYEGTLTLKQGVTYEMYAGFHVGISGGVTGPVTEITAGITTVSEPKAISESAINPAYTTVTFSIDYESSNSGITWVRIYGREKDSGTGFGVLKSYSITATAVSGSLEVPVNMKRGVTYEIYAVISSASVQGETVEFTPA